MPATAKEFLELIVEPTVAEFIQSPYDLRRGLLAAMVLSHVADHVAQEGFPAMDRKTMDQRVITYRNRMLAICPDFQLIQDVGDATKHAKLAISREKVRSVPASEKVTASPGLFQAPLNHGAFAEACGVTVELLDGTKKPLLPAVLAVLHAWTSLLRETNA